MTWFRIDDSIICPKCGKTLLGCRLNKRLNRPYWVAIHWTRRETA